MAPNLTQHPGKIIPPHQKVWNESASQNNLVEADFNVTTNQAHHYSLFLVVEYPTILSYQYRSTRADLGHGTKVTVIVACLLIVFCYLLLKQLTLLV